MKNRLQPSSFCRARSFYAPVGLAVAMLALLAWPTYGFARSPAGLSDNSEPPLLGQNDGADQNEISTDQIEKYVSVYKAMQRNRSLTVDQAAAQQGLTVEQFRDLENRVQRDDAALQQARDELQAAAKTASPTPGKNTTPAR